MLDLGEVRAVHAVGASFLQDMRSWIMMPRELVVEVSVDGTSWHEAGRVGHQVPEREEGVFRRDFTVELDGLEIQAVRFYAAGYGPLPEWHLGAGGPSFIFVDELIVK